MKVRNTLDELEFIFLVKLLKKEAKKLKWKIFWSKFPKFLGRKGKDEFIVLRCGMIASLVYRKLMQMLEKEDGNA